MLNMIGETEPKINTELPIAYLIPKTQNHLEFKWLGVTLNDGQKWLNLLDDEVYWGKRAQEFGYNITFLKENR
jgi:hypothetical protein